MIEMCYFYTTTGHPNFKPKCWGGLEAGLKCRSKNNCPAYAVVLDEYASIPDDEVMSKISNFSTTENSQS